MLDDATKKKVWPGKIIWLACSASGNATTIDRHTRRIIRNFGRVEMVI